MTIINPSGSGYLSRRFGSMEELTAAVTRENGKYLGSFDFEGSEVDVYRDNDELVFVEGFLGFDHFTPRWKLLLEALSSCPPVD